MPSPTYEILSRDCKSCSGQMDSNLNLEERCNFTGVAMPMRHSCRIPLRNSALLIIYLVSDVRELLWRIELVRKAFTISERSRLCEDLIESDYVIYYHRRYIRLTSCKVLCLLRVDLQVRSKVLKTNPRKCYGNKQNISVPGPD